MPLDPSIIGGLQQVRIPSPAEAETASLDVQAKRLKVGEEVRSLKNQAAVRSILARYGGDLEKARPELYQVDPELGMKVDASLLAQKTHALDFQKAQSEYHAQQVESLGRLAETVDDDLSLQSFRQSAKAMGIPEADQIPPVWNEHTKLVLQGIRQSAIPVVEQEREKARQAEQARKDLDEQRRAAADAAKVKKDEAAAALALEDKRADNARDAARLNLEAQRVGYEGQRVGLEGQRVALERQKLPASQGGPDVEIKPDSREFRIAQDLAYGKLTMADFQRMYGRAASNAALKEAMYDKARTLNPNFNPAAFEMGFKLASNPKVQQQLASLDNVTTGVPDLIKASDAAKRSGSPTLNAYAIKPISVALGSKKYSNFKTAVTAFADELSGALGYGSATDMSREMGFDMTDMSQGPENFASNVQDIVLPFVARKRGSILKQMGVYGEPGMNPAAPPPAAKGADPLGIR